MNDNFTSIIAAVKVLRKENKDSDALLILEDVLSKMCDEYLADRKLSSMSFADSSNFNREFRVFHRGRTKLKSKY